MYFRIQIAITDGETEHVQEIAELMRPDATIETMGLTLEESKQILHALQQTMVEHQAMAYLEQQRPCPHCQKQRQMKDMDTAPFRTLFGTIQVPNPRWYHCRCQDQGTRTFRPLATLLPERTSPELLYLETKWASLASYGITSKLLHEVLPIDQKHGEITVRNHLLRMANVMSRAWARRKLCFWTAVRPRELVSRSPMAPSRLASMVGLCVRAEANPEGRRQTYSRLSRERVFCLFVETIPKIRLLRASALLWCIVSIKSPSAASSTCSNLRECRLTSR